MPDLLSNPPEDREAMEVMLQPPHRTYEDPWEPDPDSSVEIEQMVPVAGSLLRGFTYERRIRVEHRVWRRRVYEYWDIPARREPLEEPVHAATYDYTLGMGFTVKDIPARTFGRWHYEYRNA